MTPASDVRNVAKRIRRRACRLTDARSVRVLHRNGAFRIIVDTPRDGRTTHALILPRVLRMSDDFAGLKITCEVVS